MRRAVFLDRDGVVNDDHPSYISRPEDIQILPGSADAIRRLGEAGFLTIVVSNQSGLGRGYFDQPALDSIHAKIRHELAGAGATLDAIRYCPHTPADACPCRKPGTLLVERAAEEFGIDLAASYFVGDKGSDVLCGARSGCRTVLVRSGSDPNPDLSLFVTAPDHIADDLAAAADWIVAQPWLPGN